MNNNQFFNPSPLYKEFMLLDVIEKNHSITQRDMSSLINASVSMVNGYLTKYENKDLIERVYLSPKNVVYKITDSGRKRRKLLNLWFMSDSHKIYLQAKSNLLTFFQSNNLMNIDSLYLYGAGDMAAIILDLVETDKKFLWNIEGIIDDDPIKIGDSFRLYKVLGFNSVIRSSFDYIIITSYNYHLKIYNKLISAGINRKKIISFFDR